MVLPGPTAKATPVAGFTVATAVLLLLQLPPPVPPLLAKVVEEPLHIVVSLTVPATGRGFTITEAVAEGIDVHIEDGGV